MPTSFRLALAGMMIALVGVGVFAFAVLVDKGWDAITAALAGMAVNGAGLLLVLVSAVTCAVRVPAWRKGAIALLGVALLGIGVLVYVWSHA